MNWLRSGTSIATLEVARRTLAQAHSEYRVGAWLSAETSAWEAIRWAAESVDQNRRETPQQNPRNDTASALTNLQIAKQAIIEARDFSGVFDTQSPNAISRIARSHQTNILSKQTDHGLSGTDASDQYLDFARSQLASIASSSTDAAEAMDLLAAIYLRRADAKTLPSATALCLRRAAIQGQPGNASLAKNLGMHLAQVGLYREARWALEHSISIQPDPHTTNELASLLKRTGLFSEAEALVASMGNQNQHNGGERRIRVPEITRLTPEEFAALSKSVIWTDETNSRSNQTASKSPPNPSTQVNAVLTGARSNDQQTVVDSTTQDDQTEVVLGVPKKVSPWKRLKNSWNRLTE